jgi:hypothetical protein
MSTVQSYLAASGSAVALRMEEMRQKEARDRESAATAAAALRRTVEIASIDWEAEVLLAIEKIPGLLDAVRPMVLAGVQTPKKMAGREGVIWVDSVQQPRRLFDPKCLYEGACPVLAILRGIHYGFTEADVPKEATLLNEQARFRVRLLTKVFHSLQEQAKAEAATAFAAYAAEIEAKAAEEARVVAEKKALVMASQAAAMEEQRGRIRAHVKAHLYGHPTINTLCHNFTETDGISTLFVAYRHQTKAPPVRFRHGDEKFLEVSTVSPLHGVTPAFSEYMTTMKVPEAWASHYEEGRLPFLPVCPTCGKANYIRKCALEGGGNTIGDVECWEHYRWNPDNNQHYKWARMPPRPVYVGFYPDGHWVLWDPKDPDGSKAAQAAKDKQIAEKEEKIRKLQEELMSLR